MAKLKYFPLQIVVAAIVLFCDFTSAHPFWWHVKPLGMPLCPQSSSSDNVCYDLEVTRQNCTTVVKNDCHHHGHKRSIVLYKATIKSGPCYRRQVTTCVNYRCIQKCCNGYQRDNAGKCALPADMDVPECRNGGTPQGNKCLCPRHYHGDRCETAICDRECMNGGYCHGNITMEAPKCVCTSNFTGDHCQTPVCGDGCENNGTCIQDRMHVKCLCQNGYYGDQCQNKTDIKKCPKIPKHFNTDCTDRCSEDQPCGSGEYCCEYKGEKICIVTKRLEHQRCSYRNVFNRQRSVNVGETFIDYYDNLCRCRPNPWGKYYGGIKDCTVMHCNQQNSQCAIGSPEDTPASHGHDHYRKPIITNCPEKGHYLPAVVSEYSNKAIFNFNFDAKDYRGQKLETFIKEHIFTARNNTHDDIFHNKVTSAKDYWNNTAECCFGVQVLDRTPPRFLSCPADITAFSGEIIQWLEPEAVDNVGIQRVTKPHITNGTIISSGFYVLKYAAEDWSGNTAHCSFSIQATEWNSNSNGWSESLRSRVEPNTAVIIGGAVVGILSIVLIILAVFVVRSCRVRSQTQRELSRRRLQNRQNPQRQISISSIYSNEPPPYDVAAKDKLPEYTPRDDPPIYVEKEETKHDGPKLEGCDNPTYNI